MSSQNPQVVDSNEFIELLDYAFIGDTYTLERKRSVVAAYREHGTIYHAAQVARVSRKTVYNWMEHDTAFAQAMNDSKEDCSDKVESSVYKKAIAGSTLDAIFYLKAKRPEFRDRVAVDVKAVENDIKSVLGELTARLAMTPPTSPDNNQHKKLQPAVIDVESGD